MSARLDAAVRRWWAGEAGLVGRGASALAAPLERAYAFAVARRNRRFDVRGGERIKGLGVVSLGNLSVGGTGKTPMAAWATRLLADHGIDTALVSRGYGRDELLLHHRWNPDVPIVADADRVAAARLARSRGADVIVLDDGFQHRHLARDVDLVLLAATEPYPARLLPRGPFREPTSSLARAHGVVVTRRIATSERAHALVERVGREHPHLVVGLVSLLPNGWQDLAGSEAPAPEGGTLAAAAVARPRSFVLQVEMATGADSELMAFPDHHEYTEADARAIRARAGARTVVVTEKDAVKLQRFEALLEPVRVMVQALRWVEGEQRIAGLVTSVVPKEI